MMNRIITIIHHPRIRSFVHHTFYMAASITILEVTAHWHDQTRPHSTNRLHLKMFPLIVSLTVIARHVHQPPFQSPWLKPQWRPLIGGIVLGAGSFSTWLYVAWQQGWVRVPTWGWERTSKQAILRSLVFFSCGNAAIAWNEETVFRGHGFDTLRATIGNPSAGVILTSVFALAHSSQPLVVIGELSLGLVLLLLRIDSSTIWLPIGYHWASNMMQSAIFGIPQAEPSLFPLVVTGPYHWTGRPGKAEPGWLFVLLNLIIATFLVIRRWYTRKHAHKAV